MKMCEQIRFQECEDIHDAVDWILSRIFFEKKNRPATAASDRPP
jgi:hypothetical protein